MQWLEIIQDFLELSIFLILLQSCRVWDFGWYARTDGGWGYWGSFFLLLLSSITTSSSEVTSPVICLPFSKVSLFSGQTSISLPLCKVIALSCSLRLASVLLGRLPCHHSEFALANCPLWFSIFWMNAWTFLKVAFTVSNFISVLTMNLANTSSVEDFLSLGGEGWYWNPGGCDDRCCPCWPWPPHMKFGWFLYSGLYMLHMGCFEVFVLHSQSLLAP